MNRATLIVTAIVFAGALRSSALAQQPSPTPGFAAPGTAAPEAPGIHPSREERRARLHAAFEEVKKNPTLVNDAEFLKQHPQFARWLDRHPEARKELRENPNKFLDNLRARREEMRKRHLERGAGGASNPPAETPKQ